MEQINKGSVRPVFFLKVLAFSYVVTVASLMLLALLLYKFRFGEMVVNVGIILIYILACFVSGFLTGKRMERRKFLWGFVVGLGYFIILLLVSYGLKSETGQLGGDMISTLFLCAASGMLGGMLSS